MTQPGRRPTAGCIIIKANAVKNQLESTESTLTCVTTGYLCVYTSAADTQQEVLPRLKNSPHSAPDGALAREGNRQHDSNPLDDPPSNIINDSAFLITPVWW